MAENEQAPKKVGFSDDVKESTAEVFVPQAKVSFAPNPVSRVNSKNKVFEFAIQLENSIFNSLLLQILLGSISCPRHIKAGSIQAHSAYTRSYIPTSYY